MHMEGGRGCHLQHTQGVVHAHLHLRRLLPSAVLLMRARGHPEVAAAAAALAAALPHSRRIDVVRSSRNHAPQQHRPHHQRASAQPRHRSGEADGHPVGVFGLRGRRSAASYATDEAVRVVCRYACPHLSLTEGPSRRAPRSSAEFWRDMRSPRVAPRGRARKGGCTPTPVSAVFVCMLALMGYGGWRLLAHRHLLHRLHTHVHTRATPRGACDNTPASDYPSHPPRRCASSRSCAGRWVFERPAAPLRSVMTC